MQIKENDKIEHYPTKKYILVLNVLENNTYDIEYFDKHNDNIGSGNVSKRELLKFISHKHYKYYPNNDYLNKNVSKCDHNWKELALFTSTVIFCKNCEIEKKD